MSVASDARVIPSDEVRTFAAVETARRILDNTYSTPRELLIGSVGIDLSQTRCSICRGSFPLIGRAYFVIDEHGEVRYGHCSCFVDDLRAWAHGPLESCENGCDICLPIEEGA